MGREHDQVVVVIVNEPHDRPYGVAVGRADLGQMDPELVADIRHRAALGQNSPVACRIDRIGALAVPSLIPYGLW